MSIERQKGKMTLVCDSCGDEYEWYPPADFNSMINDARDDGWHIEKTDEAWEHMCDHCLKHAPMVS